MALITLPHNVVYENLVMYDVCFNGTSFVGVGQINSNPIAYTSPDGISWTPRTTGLDGSGSGYTLKGIAWNGSIYCAVGYLNTSANYYSRYIVTSSDGITWTQKVKLASGSYAAINITYWDHMGYFYICTHEGVLRTSDGSSFVKVFNNSRIWAIDSYGPYMAVAQDSANYLYYHITTNEVDWVTIPSGTSTPSVRRMFHDTTYFYHVDELHKIYRLKMSDGSLSADNTFYPSSIIRTGLYDGTNLLLVGDYISSDLPGVYQNVDGVWTKLENIPEYSYWNIIYCNGRHIVTGNGIILYSDSRIKINGKDTVNYSKINGFDIGDISKINGVTL